MVSEHIAFSISWASWGSVIAGGVTAIAVSIIMAILGVALGFKVIDPKADEPASGLGVAFGVWSFISIIVSMAAGGFVAGLFAGQRGLEHGFLVWAVVTIAATCFSGIALGAAVRSIGSILRNVGSGAADVLGSVGKGAANAASGAVAELKENVHLNLDTDKLNEDVAGVLRDTGVESLQPEYLQKQMREARSDVRMTLHQLALEPHNSEQIIGKLLDKEKARLDSLTKSVDKEAAITTLMNTRHIPRQEAETMVDNAVKAYGQAAAKAKETLAEARAQTEEVRSYFRDLAARAREKADSLATAASRAALASAVALMLAAAISMGAGMYGAARSGDMYTVQNTYFMR